jgi:hypothetical protein
MYDEGMTSETFGELTVYVPLTNAASARREWLSFDLIIIGWNSPSHHFHRLSLELWLNHHEAS